MKQHYIIYQITNLVNKHFYIGKHKTTNLADCYFGSGKILRLAIAKYGKQNFEFKVLFELQSLEEMNLLEKYVVTPEFCQREDVYNLKTGGEGGAVIGHIVKESTRQKLSLKHKGRKRSAEVCMNMSKAHLGHKASEETKQKMSSSQLGKNKGKIPWNKGKKMDDNYKLIRSKAAKGRIYVNDGKKTKLVFPDKIPEGFVRGRLI